MPELKTLQKKTQMARNKIIEEQMHVIEAQEHLIGVLKYQLSIVASGKIMENNLASKQDSDDPDSFDASKLLGTTEPVKKIGKIGFAPDPVTHEEPKKVKDKGKK
jgi:hypothetical protein